MKKFSKVGVNNKFHVFIVVSALINIFLASCEPSEDRLGVDIFPAGDTILIYTDTITNIETQLVRSRPRITSIIPGSEAATRSFFLGSRIDTITGLSTAEIVTEFDLNKLGDFGDSATIDSLRLYLYFNDVIGIAKQEMHLLIYEFLDSLDIDSVYYSNYDISGKFDPTPLVDEYIIPAPDSVYEFELQHGNFLDRIRESLANEDSIFVYPSRLQRAFPGLYLKTESVTEGGSFAKVQLANSLSGLKFKYLHDTIDEVAADTVPFSTFSMSFTQYFAQKINIFHHDFTGTYLESILDKPDKNPKIAYAQGMSGVNVKIKLPDLISRLDIKEGDKVAINGAKLIFYVVPDSISGIETDNYPQKLMLDLKLDDDTYSPIYDYLTNTNEYYFGRLTQSNERSAFLEPLYYYNFHIGRHLQSVISGELENSDLIIYVDKPVSNTSSIKFWSNYSDQNGSLKLELVYTKF